MSIVCRNLSKKSEEQINNKDAMNSIPDQDNIHSIMYYGIKKILEKDEYEIFELNSKKQYNKKLKKSNDIINKLITINQKSKQLIKKINNELTELKSNNSKIVDVLNGKLS